MRKDKFQDVKYVDSKHQAQLRINNRNFRRLMPLERGAYEVVNSKTLVVHDIPIYVGNAILNYAKKHLLDCYYEVLDLYLAWESFQMFLVDMDS